MGGCKQQKQTLHQFWRLDVQSHSPGGLVSPEGSGRSHSSLCPAHRRCWQVRGPSACRASSGCLSSRRFSLFLCALPSLLFWGRSLSLGPTLIQEDFIWDHHLNYIYKGPYSKRGHILRLLVTTALRSVSSSLRCVRLLATPWTAARQASLSITKSRSPPEPMSIESVMPSNHLILCCPLLLLPSIFPSIRVFSSESALHIRWPKNWSFSFSISPSSEHLELISFRMDWLDLLAVQGTLKSLLQHHRSKASVLQCSAFFIV